MVLTTSRPRRLQTSPGPSGTSPGVVPRPQLHAWSRDRKSRHFRRASWGRSQNSGMSLDVLGIQISRFGLGKIGQQCWDPKVLRCLRCLRCQEVSHHFARHIIIHHHTTYHPNDPWSPELSKGQGQFIQDLPLWIAGCHVMQQRRFRGHILGRMTTERCSWSKYAKICQNAVLRVKTRVSSSFQRYDMIFQPSPRFKTQLSNSPKHWYLDAKLAPRTQRCQHVPSRWVVQSNGRKGIATFTEERIAVEGKTRGRFARTLAAILW